MMSLTRFLSVRCVSHVAVRSSPVGATSNLSKRVFSTFENEDDRMRREMREEHIKSCEFRWQSDPYYQPEEGEPGYKEYVEELDRIHRFRDQARHQTLARQSQQAADKDCLKKDKS